MTLLEHRAMIKGKKPHFMRSDAHKHPRLKTGWRKPQGIDSKMRLGLKGYKRKIEVGWKSPRDIRGFHASGVAQILVHSPGQVAALDPKAQGIILGSGVGKKKRLEIIAKAQERNVTILNIKDPAAYVKGVQDDLQKRKQSKTKKADTTEKVKEKKLEKVLSEEEKAKQEKAEKDKVLTQRQS